MDRARRDRVFGLDIFRAVAIWLVLLLHSRPMLDGTALAGFSFVRVPDGVELFFVLSGFLIGGILLRTMERGTFDLPALWTFWKRRWFRTLPGYYLILAVNYVVVRYNVIHEGIYNFNWKYFFFLQNFSKPFVGFYRESWSLSIEEWFYVIVPVLLFILLRWLKPRNAYLLATCLMLIIPVVFRSIWMDTSYDRFWVDLSIRKIVVTRLDSIGYGLLAAWLWHYYPERCMRYRWPAFVIGIVASVLLLAYRQPPHTVYSQVVYFTLSPLFMAMLLPAAAGVRHGTGPIAALITYTSRISYSLYLINFSLVAEVIHDQFPPRGGVDSLLKYLAFWLIVYAAASLLYYLWEKPMMQLRDKRSLPVA